jgi:hypothetical protein
MLSPEFQEENTLEINENVLIEATKYSSIIECIKKIASKILETDDEDTIRKGGESRRNKAN